MKKLVISALLLTISLASFAQWKVTSVDTNESDHIDLRYIIEMDDATLIYGTFTRGESLTDSEFSIDRKFGAYVDGVKYKIINSVNFPLYDEAETRRVKLENVGDQVNFVLFFQKFPVQDGFDLIYDKSRHESVMNFYGIHVVPVDPDKFINTEAFLDSFPVDITGVYSDNGNNVAYEIFDGVSVSCRCSLADSGELFGYDDFKFYVEIINNSDHGVKFDYDNKTYVIGYKKKKNGKVEEKYLTKYNPSSYEAFERQLDYDEARRATENGMGILSDKLSRESRNNDNGDLGKLGFSILSSLSKQVVENNIQTYLQNHPKSRPAAMKSQSINAGDSYGGYIAVKGKKVDNFVIHIKLNDHDYSFNWAE